MKRQHAESFLKGAFPTDSLVAFVVGGPNNGATLDASDSPGSRHPADLQVYVAKCALDPQMRIASHASACVMLTDARLAIASVGGLLGVRPKELHRSAARGEFRCEWWINDESDAPAAAYCNMLFRFPDASWAALGVATKLLGRSVKSAGLADEMISALGPDAIKVDWRNPPPS